LLARPARSGFGELPSGRRGVERIGDVLVAPTEPACNIFGEPCCIEAGRKIR
jgi:hypothetical protein